MPILEKVSQKTTAKTASGEEEPVSVCLIPAILIHMHLLPE
jgi:hypothetical protein